MILTLTDEQAQNLLVFINRANITGAEAHVAVELKALIVQAQTNVNGVHADEAVKELEE